jgi:hypothetical protein
MLDNFFACVITPIFFVECLADLEKKMRAIAAASGFG